MTTNTTPLREAFEQSCRFTTSELYRTPAGEYEDMRVESEWRMWNVVAREIAAHSARRSPLAPSPAAAGVPSEHFSDPLDPGIVIAGRVAVGGAAA